MPLRALPYSSEVVGTDDLLGENAPVRIIGMPRPNSAATGRRG